MNGEMLKQKVINVLPERTITQAFLSAIKNPLNDSEEEKKEGEKEKEEEEAKGGFDDKDVYSD